MKAQPRALPPPERDQVLALLHEERLVDLAPAEVHAILLDEGAYLCSVATTYRLLRAAHGAVRERHRQASHPARVRPESVATAADQVWSRDITELAGPAERAYHHPYTIIDIHPRCVVG